MKEKRRLVIQYFLRTLQLRMRKDEYLEEVTPALGRMLTKEDLKGIVKCIFKKKVPEGKDIDSMDEEELLEAIPSGVCILNYLLAAMSKELDDASKLTVNGVFATLEQLGLHTHYLRTKRIEDWDKYDHSNYRSLSIKAGNLIPFYGIYDSNVKEEDKYLLLPGKLYNAEWEAQEALSKFYTEGGKFHDGDLKIMAL